jgi:multicomponent Na+:H+ antiporter subunit F
MNYLAHDPTFFRIAAMTSLVLLVASMALSFCRLMIGKSLPDRVVALDNISMLVMCIITVFAIITRHPIYIDIVIALALISFLSLIAFAQFIEWQLGKVPPHSRWRER